MARGFPDLPFLMEEKIVAALRGDSTLVGYLGGNRHAIREFRTFQELMVPSIGVQRIDTAELEIEGLALFQFHFFARAMNDTQTTAGLVYGVRTIRNAALRIVHSDYHWTVGGLDLFSLYQGGRRHDDPTATSVYVSDDIEYHPYRVTVTA